VWCMHMGNGRDFGPVQLPSENMVDSKAIPHAVFAVLNVLISDLIESHPPLQVGVLEGRSASLGDLADDDLGVVVFKDPQEANQSWVASRLPC